MEWILETSEEYRSQLRAGPFFKKLPFAKSKKDLLWVHQLVHQSREFTQALCLRYSLCHDRRFQHIFAEHAYEETDHPDHLIAWMVEHGYLDGSEPGSMAPTPETTDTLSFCWRAAMREPPDVQIVALNVVSEGVALDFYRAVIPVLQRLDLLTGGYWTVHSDVDADHLRLGLDKLGEVAPDSDTGMLYRRVLWQAANLYHHMLSSWVGERVESLPMLGIREQAMLEEV